MANKNSTKEDPVNKNAEFQCKNINNINIPIQMEVTKVDYIGANKYILWIDDISITIYKKHSYVLDIVAYSPHDLWLTGNDPLKILDNDDWVVENSSMTKYNSIMDIRKKNKYMSPMDKLRKSLGFYNAVKV